MQTPRLVVGGVFGLPELEVGVYLWFLGALTSIDHEHSLFVRSDKGKI